MFTRRRNPTKDALYSYNPGAMGGPPPVSPPRRRTLEICFQVCLGELLELLEIELLEIILV
jgi:hypothetical protein